MNVLFYLRLFLQPAADSLTFLKEILVNLPSVKPLAFERSSAAPRSISSKLIDYKLELRLRSSDISGNGVCECGKRTKLNCGARVVGLLALGPCRFGKCKPSVGEFLLLNANGLREPVEGCVRHHRIEDPTKEVTKDTPT